MTRLIRPSLMQTKQHRFPLKRFAVTSVHLCFAGYLYTSDYQQSWRVSMALEYGLVGVNESLTSTCEAPFGGVKHSGIGKEGAQEGLDDFLETKYICFGALQM